VLSTCFESVEDLEQHGMKALPARALFKLIRVWNSVGVPQADLTIVPSVTNNQSSHLNAVPV
jgi:hypothetical protein